MPPAIASSSPRSTRIRENQRRSRQRRRDYILSLESRLAQCRTEGVSATHEVQKAAKRVKRENDALRKLLRAMGVEDDVLERSISRWQEDEADAEGEDPPTGPGIGDGLYREQQESSPPCGRSDRSSSLCCSPTTTTSATSATSASSQYPPPPTSTFCAPFNFLPFPTKERASPCSTLSCEDAHRLIKRLLVRQSPPDSDRAMAEIATRLYPGFREAATPGEPCRVLDELFCDVMEMLIASSSSSRPRTSRRRERQSSSTSPDAQLVGQDMYTGTSAPELHFQKSMELQPGMSTTATTTAPGFSPMLSRAARGGDSETAPRILRMGYISNEEEKEGDLFAQMGMDPYMFGMHMSPSNEMAPALGLFGAEMAGVVPLGMEFLEP